MLNQIVELTLQNVLCTNASQCITTGVKVKVLRLGCVKSLMVAHLHKAVHIDRTPGQQQLFFVCLLVMMNEESTQGETFHHFKVLHLLFRSVGYCNVLLSGNYLSLIHRIIPGKGGALEFEKV